MVAAAAARPTSPARPAAPPAPAPAAFAPVQAAYSATNGKWTIGGLNKHDVYKLIVNGGL